MFNYQYRADEEQVVVQGCQILVLLLLKANNTSVMGGVHLTNLPPLNWPLMYSQCGMTRWYGIRRILHQQGNCLIQQFRFFQRNASPLRASSHLKSFFSVTYHKHCTDKQTLYLPHDISVANYNRTQPNDHITWISPRPVSCCGGDKGYNNEGFVVENVAVGFPQGFLRTLLTGESHEGLAFHPPLLH